MKKKIREILIKNIYFIFSRFVILSLFYGNFKKTKLIYPLTFGFGDFAIFCVKIRKRINIDNKIFCFSKQQYKLASLFFDEENIYKSFILMPSLMNDHRLVYDWLIKKKNF